MSKAQNLQSVPEDEPKASGESPTLNEPVSETAGKTSGRALSVLNGGNGGAESASPSAPDYSTAVTANKVLKLLKGGASKNTDVEIAGEKVSNPKEALVKFKEALSLVKKYFSDHLTIDLDDLQFHKLGGDKVGESTDSATLLDPKLFRHPVMVVAVVIAHELRHQNDTIQNEGLVQEGVDTVFGSEDIGHKYGMMVADFRKFAVRFDRGKNAKRGGKEIYRLYTAEKFDEIYKIYEKNHINKLKTADAKDEAFEFFKGVFPELDYSDSGEKDGDFGVKKLPRRLDAEAETSQRGVA